jgi:hypothetical protein
MCNRVIIAGGRDLLPDKKNLKVVKNILDKLKGEVILISGFARGADQIPVMLHEAGKYDLIPFPVTKKEWATIGPSAGHRRNERMVDEGKATHLIAFWDGYSKGTKGMIDYARKKGLKVKVVKYKRKEV